MKKIVIFFLSIVIFFISNIHSGSYPNHAAIFTGITTENISENSYLTLGADYSYRLNSFFSAGIITDFVFASHFQSLFFASVFFHAGDSLRLWLAPGIEIADGHSVYATRLGTAYDFHVNSVSISPTFSADFISNHVLYVMGISFGLGF